MSAAMSRPRPDPVPHCLLSSAPQSRRRAGCTSSARSSAKSSAKSAVVAPIPKAISRSLDASVSSVYHVLFVSRELRKPAAARVGILRPILNSLSSWLLSSMHVWHMSHDLQSLGRTV